MWCVYMEKMELSLMLEAIRARIAGEMNGDEPFLGYALNILGNVQHNRSVEEAQKAWELVRLQGPLVFFMRDPEDILSEYLCRTRGECSINAGREIMYRLRPTFYNSLEAEEVEKREQVYKFFHQRNYVGQLFARFVHAAELWMENRTLDPVERALKETVNRPYNKNFEQLMLIMYERWTSGNTGSGKRMRRRLDHEQYPHIAAALARRDAIMNTSVDIPEQYTSQDEEPDSP